MERYNFIIIDDELPAHLSVKQCLKRYPNYTCAGAFYKPEEALLYLQDNKIDLIFLDIEMPLMDGFQFLQALEKEVFVVILTAYPEKHGLSAHNYYDKNLLFFSNKAQFSYYLPKIIAHFEKKQAEKDIVERAELLVKNEINTFPMMIHNKALRFSDIVFIVVIGHNIVLKMKTGEENVFRMSFPELMQILPKNSFIQIRRSVIINIWYITAYTDTSVCVKEYHFQIAMRRRKVVIPFFQVHLQELYQQD
jgi:DNA-binding LytR/AlgR family response regulator